jgi:hypothetical protein
MGHFFRVRIDDGRKFFRVSMWGWEDEPSSQSGCLKLDISGRRAQEIVKRIRFQKKTEDNGV